MNEQLLRLYVWHVNLRAGERPQAHARFNGSERGEGVISVAIAVLIMAFLGVIVWGGFKLTLESTQKKVDDQVEKIGN